MKLVHRDRKQGSALIVALLTAIILAMALGSYLLYTNTQTLLVRRAQQWNAALTLSEAGIEEALAHVNNRAPFLDYADATNRLATDGWAQITPNQFRGPARYLGDGFYVVTITLTWPTIQIDSIGYARAIGGSKGIQGILLGILGQQFDNSGYIKRQVRVMARVDPLFATALAGRQKVDLNGNNVFTDAFDSSDPRYSENGRYPGRNSNKILPRGTVATSGEFTNSIVNVGNAEVMGRVLTGPLGIIMIGPQGSVGDVDWVRSGQKGIKPGWAANDMNVIFPEVSSPPGAIWIPKAKDNQRVDGVLYDYVFNTSGDYIIPGGGNIYVGTNAQVRLLVVGNFKMSGNDDRITIAPSNASLKLFMMGSVFKLSGLGVVNQSGFATNFMYFGLPSNKSVDISGNAELVGLIYAPNADIFLRGGGNNVIDVIGSIVGNSVTMNGHFAFHYDVTLQNVAGARGFIPFSWQEVQ